MNRTVWLTVLIAIVGVAAVIPSARGSAHEDDVLGDGQYEVVVGFLDEPAFVGEKNGLQLYVAKLASMATPEPGDATPIAADEVFDRPIEGLETTLQAEVVYGDQRLSLSLEPVFDSPGEYVSYFFPTAVGDYSFRIFGAIEDSAVDATFTSSPSGFSSVLPRVEFPAVTTQTSPDSAGISRLPTALALVGVTVGAVAYVRRRRLL